MPASVLNTLSNSGPGLLPGLFRNNEMIILSSKLGRLSTAKKRKTYPAFVTIFPLFSLMTHSWSRLANMFTIVQFMEFFFTLYFFFFHPTGLKIGR